MNLEADVVSYDIAKLTEEIDNFYAEYPIEAKERTRRLLYRTICDMILESKLLTIRDLASAFKTEVFVLKKAIQDEYSEREHN